MFVSPFFKKEITMEGDKSGYLIRKQCFLHFALCQYAVNYEVSGSVSQTLFSGSELYICNKITHFAAFQNYGFIFEYHKIWA